MSSALRSSSEKVRSASMSRTDLRKAYRLSGAGFCCDLDLEDEKSELEDESIGEEAEEEEG